MVKKPLRLNTPKAKGLPPSVPPQAPPTKTKRLHFKFYFDFLEYNILKAGKRLQFFCWLKRDAAIYSRVVIEANSDVFLQPGQGIFKSSLMAKRLKISRTTAKKYMRDLKKYKFIVTKRYPLYSVFTLLAPRSYDKTERASATTPSTPTSTPPGTPPGTPYKSRESRDSIEMINPKHQLCTKLELGLPSQLSGYLLFNYAKKIKCVGKCNEISEVCKRDLEKMANQIKKKIKKSPDIANYQNYAKAVVNNFLKGGE